MNFYIDIETIPKQGEKEAKEIISSSVKAPAAMKKQETIDEWHAGVGKYAGVKDKAIEDAYRSTSFDGAQGQICSIAMAVSDGEIWSKSDKGITERELLIEFTDHIKNESKASRHPFFVGHYISGFDLRFLYQRLVINGVNPMLEIPFSGRHDQQYFDTMVAWCGYKERISQDNLCKALGIKGKPDGIDGSKVWDFYKAGKIDEIEEYNRDDIDKVRQIHKRLTFLR